MNRNSFLRIFSLFSFAAFMLISCWATVESLHLFLPTWPVPIFWVFTIGIFVLASLGSKLIVDSFDPDIRNDRRGWSLIGGIVLMLLCWVVCSFPTNTHTFFYRASIHDVVTQDLSTTKKYLQDLHDNVVAEESVKGQCDQVEHEVKTALKDLESEIDNMANPGFGPRSKAILDRIAVLLDVPQIEELSHTSSVAPQEMKRLKIAYRKKIFDLLRLKQDKIKADHVNADEATYKGLAKEHIEEIAAVQNRLRFASNIQNDVIEDANQVLKQAYATVKNYGKYIDLKKEDKALYNAENQVTKTSKMLSVYDVWMDFFAGKYAGRGFAFWIIIALLVDVAGFIFFDIAFKTDH